MAKTEGPDPFLFFFSFVLQFIGVLTLALFIYALGIQTAINGGLIRFFAGAGFLFSLAGTISLFSETPFKLHIINSGYHVVGSTIAGLILGWW